MKKVLLEQGLGPLSSNSSSAAAGFLTRLPSGDPIQHPLDEGIWQLLLFHLRTGRSSKNIFPVFFFNLRELQTTAVSANIRVVRLQKRPFKYSFNRRRSSGEQAGPDSGLLAFGVPNE